MKELIRRILAEHAMLAVSPEALGDDDDLFAAGLSSHAVVNVLVALEDELRLELPEGLLRPSAFRSVSSLEAAFVGLRSPVA